jgi:hypothetical protein
MYIYVCVCVYTCICCINGFSNTVSCFKSILYLCPSVTYVAAALVCIAFSESSHSPIVPTTQEAEAEGFQVQGQHGQHNETLSQNTKLNAKEVAKLPSVCEVCD